MVQMLVIHPCSYYIELLANRYQWVLIDCEHGNIDDHNMYLQVGAISSSGASPIVRIPASEPWMIKRVLDAGAHGVMVPMCETKVG